MSDEKHEWTIATLQRLCDERAEETTTLEFKPCDELRIGSQLSDHKNKERRERKRTRDDVMVEFTKDVTAFLNAAGGTLIYGILEKDSRADKIDRDKAFKRGRSEDDVDIERVQNWLRSHVLPPPSIEAFRVFEDSADIASPWYLVFQIGQGATAYQAQDRRFYRRYGPTVKPMEQYEVVEVMHRRSIPEAEVEFGFQSIETKAERHVYSLTVKVKNLSRIVIENYKLQFIFPNYGEEYIEFRNGISRQRFGSTVSQNQDGDYVFECRSQHKLFPGDEKDLTEDIRLRYIVNQKVHYDLIGAVPPSLRRNFSVRWKLYADDMPPKSGEIPVSRLQRF